MQRHTFDSVALTLIRDTEANVVTGECAHTLPRDYRHRHRCYCSPFLGKKLVKDIDYRVLRDFKTHLSNKSISASTIATIMSFVSSVLNAAAKEGLIRAAPFVPRPQHRDSPRPAFTTANYGRLKSVLKQVELGKPEVNFKGNVAGRELRFLVTFMVNSFLRPGDVFALKHKHVQKVEPAGGDPYLRLTPPASKGHSFPIITMPVAVMIYDRVTELNRGKKLGVGPEDYVFLPGRTNREYAKEVVRRQFSEVLTIAGLKENEKGEEHTLYSLRHTAIVFRLLNHDGSMDLLTLARTCRTSVEMIDRFYASSLTAEMNRERLHSFRNPTRYRGPGLTARTKAGPLTRDPTKGAASTAN